MNVGCCGGESASCSENVTGESGGPRQFQLEPIAHGIVATQQNCRAIRERQGSWVLKYSSTGTGEKIAPSTIRGISSRCVLPRSVEPILYYYSHLTLVYNLCFSKKSPQNPRPPNQLVSSCP